MRFSISDGCFYDENIHKDIPDDSIEVSDSEFKELTAGRNLGGKITLGDDGKLKVSCADKVVPSRDDIESKRLMAYAHATTGSDRYFSEAQRMKIMEEPGWEEISAEGVKRFEAIKEQFPWPEEPES